MLILFCILLAFIYFVWHNDSLFKQPSEFHHVGWEPEHVRRIASDLPAIEAPLLKAKDLPPVTGRRYIVVGGAGFLGSWIISTLLRRGEAPGNIRIVDLQSPVEPEQRNYLAVGLEFVKADITDRSATISAFTKPWIAASETGLSKGLTVFHCAALIRYFERHSAFLPRSVGVNMGGTRNVIEASKAAGADILLYTSSANVGIRPPRLLTFPWEAKRDPLCAQVVWDEGEAEGKGDVIWRYRLHHHFCSNYAETKFRAELLVRKADKANDGKLRTGILRPGGLLYGPSSQDPVLLGFLKRSTNPVWSEATVQNILYVENCVLAHLLYEQRLLEARHGGNDIGGHAYIIVDSLCTFGDLTMALNVLTNGKTRFFHVSPTVMYLISHLIEWYELVYSGARWFLPRLNGDLMKLQPASQQIMLTNILYDDSLVRLSVEKGGLGYKEKITALEGLCHTVKWLKKHALMAS